MKPDHLTRLVRCATSALVAVMAGALGACTGMPTAATAIDTPAALSPSAWQAPLPHNGQQTELAQWWRQFNDPMLSLLIASAQDASATVFSAKSRIAQARSSLSASQAALGPSLNAVGSASRGQPDISALQGTSLSAGLQAQWEIDLFGGVHAAREAAQARLLGASAAWHDARVSVAAEVANQYTALRACEAKLAQTQLDSVSRSETARLTELTAKAGFQAPANAALARASAAQGNSLLTQQRAQCDLVVKALVALTGLGEPALRVQLAQGTAGLPQPIQLSVNQVPAQVLAQRPDVVSASREVLAAGADVSQTRAQRLPRISLGGSIGAARFSSAGGTMDGSTWSIGPVTVTLPLFDGGAQSARVDAAQARYAEASFAYAAKVRGAVREVEEALIALQSTAGREADAQVATEGFGASYAAAQARHRFGLASLFELEDARRSAVQAQSALIELQRERVASWIALYRALGGGWSTDEIEARGTSAPTP